MNPPLQPLAYDTTADAESIKKTLTPQGSELVSLSQNPVDAVWDNRPPRPKNSIFYLEEKYSGKNLF